MCIHWTTNLMKPEESAEYHKILSSSGAGTRLMLCTNTLRKFRIVTHTVQREIFIGPIFVKLTKNALRINFRSFKFRMIYCTRAHATGLAYVQWPVWWQLRERASGERVTLSSHLSSKLQSASMPLKIASTEKDSIFEWIWVWSFCLHVEY